MPNILIHGPALYDQTHIGRPVFNRKLLSNIAGRNLETTTTTDIHVDDKSLHTADEKLSATQQIHRNKFV